MEEKRTAPHRRWLLTGAGVLLAVACTLPWLIWQDEIRQFAALGYLGLFVGCFLGTAVVLMPSSTMLLVVMAASLLGPVESIVVGALGSVLGDGVSYLCGSLGANALPENARLRTLIARWSRRPELMVFVFAALPLPVFDFAGLAAGVQRMPLWRFALAVFLGRLVKYTVIVLASLVLLPWLAPRTDGLVRALIELLISMIGLPAPA